MIINVMKIKLIALALTTVTLTATAIMLLPFSSYQDIKTRSADIILARCVTNPPTLLHEGYNADANMFSVNVLITLKGTNSTRKISLLSKHWLNQGDDYLIFGNYENGVCKAIEDYRVIPLGRQLVEGTLTNTIAGKPIDQQLQVLFKKGSVLP